MQAHSRQAAALALRLADHPAIERIHHPSLESHPQRELGDLRAAWVDVDTVEIVCEDEAGDGPPQRV